MRLLVTLDNNGLETLEVGDALNNRGNNVELLLGSLVVVTLALETDTDAAGRRADTTGPEGLVESWGDTDVLDTHVLGGELLDGLDGLGGLLLEAEVVGALVQVDGVLAGHDILESGALLAGLGLVCQSVWRSRHVQARARESHWAVSMGCRTGQPKDHEDDPQAKARDHRRRQHPRVRELAPTREHVNPASLLFLLYTRMRLSSSFSFFLPSSQMVIVDTNLLGGRLDVSSCSHTRAAGIEH